MALLDSLISYWKLDEANGVREDTHGTNDLTDNNTVTSAAGLIETAAVFVAANNEWLSVANNATLEVGAIDWTFSCWLNPTNLTATRGFMNRRINSDANATFSVQVSTAGSATLLTVSGVTPTSIGSAAASVTAGAWNFVVFGWNETAKRSFIQVNNGAVVQSGVIGTPNAGTLAFEIGRGPASVASDWEGMIDEVGFWKRALTADEKTQLYNAGAGFAYPFFTTYSQSVSATGTFTASIVKQISKTLSATASWLATLTATFLEAFRPTVRIAEHPENPRTAVVPARVSSVIGRDEE